MIATLVVFTIGLYALVGGISMQWASGMSNAATVLGWYFGAFVVFAIGKMAKWKAHGNCKVHTR